MPFEWKCRTFRHFRDDRLVTAYGLRDSLIAFALGYTMNPCGPGTETANSYYDTIWCGGNFTRWPLAYPRLGAAAGPTKTLVLDRARFSRMIPTGSQTVYCLEFEKDGEYVYTIWVSRGETDVTLDLGRNSLYTLTDMTGGVTEKQKAKTIVVDEAPVYISVKSPINGVSASHRRRFPAERYPGSETAVVVQPLADAAEAEIVKLADKRIELPHSPARRRGAFSLANVMDEEKGECIEVTHLSTNNCPAMMMEYAFLKFKAPKPAPGKPDTLGLWVKGNSSWAKTYFEFTDAEGEVWFSGGTGGYGSDVYDWPHQTARNYDGWNFIQFPITGKSPVKIHSPGDHQWQWQRDMKSGNGKIDYPITLTGIAVTENGKTLNLLTMEDPQPSIRIKGLSVY